MTLTQILLVNLAVITAAMLLLWVISLIRRDAGIVDIFWGCGFVLVAWMSLATSVQAGMRAAVVAVLVSIWGLRLAGYLTWRNWGKPEDHRYAAMRERHGGRFAIVSLLSVFGLQGVVMWFVSLPLQIGISQGPGWDVAIAIGAVLWLIGVAFESIGDCQLARFKADPTNRGKVMNSGLWRYTRHPNYFGDFLVWWGFYLMSAEPGTWWWTIIGPLLMSFLLIRVSGVRLLESSLRSRVTGYEQYVRTTSAFIPWPPKHNRATPS